MSVEAVRKTGWSYVLDEQLRILVADDDPILREFASVHLSTPTAEIVTASNGVEALAQLRSAHFDVAVLDIEMPEMDGFGLLESIRQDAALSALPVVMLTGHEDIASIDRAFTFGANGFASKPVNWRLLSYQIKYVLRACALERDAARKASHPRFEDAVRAILCSAEACLGSPDLTATAERVCLHQIAKLAADAVAPGSGEPVVPDLVDA
jgi:CheY-like chemotaxis protein